MIFIKLGGSFITDKTCPETPQLELIRQAAAEIRQALDLEPDRNLLIGHGSGSFGHVAAEKHGTHLGASTPEDWRGFVEVWASANRLHRIVMDELLNAGLPVLSFPPSSWAISRKGEVETFESLPLQNAVQAGLVPVVHGDVAFDLDQGATILSTESVMQALIPLLNADRLLLAGLEEGVLQAGPEGDHVLASISRDDVANLHFADAGHSDVTGGMAGKIHFALEMKRRYPRLEIQIFSGKTSGNILQGLLGGNPGTSIQG